MEEQKSINMVPQTEESVGILSKIGSFFKKTGNILHSVVKGVAYFVTGAIISTMAAIPVIIGLPLIVGGMFWKLCRRKSREDIGKKFEAIIEEVFGGDGPLVDLDI